MSTKKNEDVKDEAEDKGGESSKKLEAKKQPEAKDEDAEAEGEDEESDAGDGEEAEEKPRKKPEAKKPETKKFDPEDPAVKKYVQAQVKAAEKKAKDEAKAAADKAAADAKLTEDERLRKQAKDAEEKQAEAERKAAAAEANLALRDAMDELEVRPAGGKARDTITAEYAAARAKDPDADPVKVLEDLQKSDPYLFKSTTAAAKDTEAEAEDRPAKKPSTTDSRGGKTPTSHRAPEKKPEALSLEETDPRKIRASLGGIRLAT